MYKSKLYTDAKISHYVDIVHIIKQSLVGNTDESSSFLAFDGTVWKNDDDLRPK